MIRVSTQRMKNDRDKLKEDVTLLRNSISELESALAFLAGCWEGPGWVSFQNQVREDMAYMNELCNELETYIKHMQDAAKVYNKSEQRAYTEVAKIWI